VDNLTSNTGLFFSLFLELVYDEYFIHHFDEGPGIRSYIAMPLMTAYGKTDGAKVSSMQGCNG